MKVIVIGGGIIGCAAALALADKGADVVLVERGDLGREASHVAAGILGAQVESQHGSDDETLQKRVRARDDYEAYCASLTERTGLPTGHRVSGVLLLAPSAAARAHLATMVAHHRALGLSAELLDAGALATREPRIAASEHGAAYFPRDAQVEPRKVLQAIVRALRQRDVAIRRAEVIGYLGTEERCHGARTSDGEIEGDAVVTCVGAFTKLLAESAHAKLPIVEPVRGHIVTLREANPSAAGLSAIVFGEDGSYVVPRGDGRLVCGTTVEHVGFERGPTAAGVAKVLAIAEALVPSTKDALFLEALTGFRPYRAEGPIIAESTIPKLYVATGHHRNGILLAKWTADEIAKLVLA